MTWIDVFGESALRIASRHQLMAVGATGAGLTSAVRAGTLIRVRRDHYALPATHPHIVKAVRVGGRLACISALRDAGVFGFDHRYPHIHMRRQASRSRSPSSRHPLTEHNREGARLHWRPLLDPAQSNEYRVGILDALIQAVWCQHQWHAIASIDNALFLGKIDDDDLSTIFAHVPRRLKQLRHQVDRRSEAGQESVLRCALRAVGIEVEVQVDIAGVGRVDFLIESRLVIEADSRLAHDGWELHVRDRDRDVDLARQGYMSLRPAYNRTMFTTREVVEAVVNLLAATRGFPTIVG